MIDGSAGIFAGLEAQKTKEAEADAANAGARALTDALKKMADYQAQADELNR